MKKNFLILLISFFFLSNFYSLKASWVDDLFENNNEVIYCKDDDDCSLEKGIEEVKTTLDDSMETQRSASVYIQAIVKYILSFVSLVAVLYIIYSGFQLLISAGNEEKTKKTKTIILHVAIGMAIMWLAYSMVAWIIEVVSVS